MADTSIIGLLLSLGLGGTAIYLFLYGMMMLGLVIFTILIINELYHTNKETAVSCK